MPRDRPTRRALVVSTVVVLLAISPGCLRSSIVRQPVEPISEVAPPVQPPPVAGTSQAGQAPQTSVSTATPISAPVVPLPLLVQPPTPNPSAPAPIESAPPVAPTEPRAEASTQPSVAPPAAAPTPLLDAALERVEALSRLEVEPLESSPMLARLTAKKGPTVVPSPVKAPISKLPTDSPPIPISIAAMPIETPKSTEPASRKNVRETRPKVAIPPEEKKLVALANRPKPAAGVASASSPLEKLTPFGVSELHLCRKVQGFGSFEPLNGTALKSGQRLLLYCEVTGLEYEPKDHGFLSRLASRIEIRSADNGSIQWEQDLGSAKDLCGRRRRDCYVTCAFELPKSLPPGNYRLKVMQTDLVANRSTSAEIPLQIVP